jgi:hypothetical protein
LLLALLHERVEKVSERERSEYRHYRDAADNIEKVED